MVLAIEPGMLLGGRRRPAGRGQLPHHRRRRREALAASRTAVVRSVIASDLIWTGALNDAVPHRRPRRPLRHDAARRRADRRRRARPASRSSRSRALLDELGVDRIEAGFPRVSEDDRRAVELIAAAGLRAEIWGFSRAVPADVEALVELGVARVGDRVADLRPASSRRSASRARRCSSGSARRSRSRRAGHHTSRFFGVDSTRAEPDFFDAGLRDRGRGGREGGRRRGHARHRLAGGRRRARRPHRRARRPDVPVHFHGHNDFGLATASAVAAVRAGARWIHGTINGMGERAGNAEPRRGRARARARSTASRSNLRLDRAREVSRARARALRLRARAVEAARRRARSSGARAAPSRASSTTRPRSSRTRPSSSAPSAAIVLGKKSGIDSIRIKAAELGLDALRGRRRATLLARVKALGAEKRGLVTDDGVPSRSLAAR